MLGREELDLVDICVPPDRHRDVLVRVLEKDFPCLVEKPLTITTVDADAVIGVANSRRVPLFVIFNYSFIPGIMKAKKLVAKGAVGEVVSVHVNHGVPWPPRHLKPDHWCHNLPGDYFSELGPHLAMLLMEFLGPAQEVKALALKRTNLPHVRMDELHILARCGGAAGSISCSLNCPSRLLTVDILGTEGALHVDGNSQAVVRYGPLDSSMNAWARGMAAARDISTRATALAGTAAGVLSGQYQVETYGHRYLIQRCLRALRGQQEYPVDVGKARETVRLLELAFAEVGHNEGI
jgi:predicted dehydrogenase